MGKDNGYENVKGYGKSTQAYEIYVKGSLVQF